jgi:transposase-like protein
MCQCPDHIYRGVKCKHIFAVEFSASIRQEVQIRRIEPEVTAQACRYCGSNQIVHAGIRHNKNGDLQKYLCRSCGHYFTINLGFEKMRATPQVITSAMQLYFTGESLRNVQKFLKLQGVKVSHVAILKWIRKYVALMNKYLEKIKPQVSDTWRADELWVKIKGDMKYLFALMDDETRFWIAQEIADSKYSHDARTLFRAGLKVAGKRPLTLITDGLKSYQEAYKKEFWTQHNPRTKHIRHITIRGDRNNNKMERMNGEIRDREKTMRGLKTVDTPILTGYQLFHNYIRTHEGLNGKTPAEACGIKIEGKNKWITIIQNASMKES